MSSPLRIGHGYDIHRIVWGRPLVLGGVRFAVDYGLEGHSDADCLTHAICDALLGAAGLPDIGHFFPNTEPAWKDIDSQVLLRRVAAELKTRRLSPVNIDATVIAEKLSTAIALGDLNTRDRDYADLHQLITRHHLDGDELTTALRNTASHRGIQLRPLSEAISDLPTRRQAPYTAWRRRQGQAAENHPATFTDLVSTVTAFADPLATGSARGHAWNPATRAWQAT